VTNYKSGWLCSQCDAFDNLFPRQQAKMIGAASYKCAASHHHYTIPQKRHTCYFLGTKKDTPASSSTGDSDNQTEIEPSIRIAVDIPWRQQRDWPSVINLKSEVKYVVVKESVLYINLSNLAI
jgi:hypothetical protein